MELKVEFFRIYANLPIEERNNVVVVIDKQPISWNIAYLEIKSNSKLGQQILKTLEELDIV